MHLLYIANDDWGLNFKKTGQLLEVVASHLEQGTAYLASPPLFSVYDAHKLDDERWNFDNYVDLYDVDPIFQTEEGVSK